MLVLLSDAHQLECPPPVVLAVFSKQGVEYAEPLLCQQDETDRDVERCGAFLNSPTLGKVAIAPYLVDRRCLGGHERLKYSVGPPSVAEVLLDALADENRERVAQHAES